MEENFEKMFESLKKQDLNPENTKKYILKIKRVLEQIKENEENNLTDNEIKESFEKDYKKDLELKAKASNIYVYIKKQRICQKILEIYKGNKNEFNRKMKTAKKLEEIDSNEDLKLALDDEKDVMRALRGAVRSVKYYKDNKRSRYYGKSELDIIKEQEKENNQLAKRILITGIEQNIKYLEKFGIIDDYINEANLTLEQLDLSELKYKKRNPITDDQVIPVPDGTILPFKDENGKEIQYLAEDSKVKEIDEDVGVLDIFEKGNLEKMPLEELLLLHLFWESKTAETNFEVSKAKKTIDYLGLWNKVINEDEETIKNIPSKDIKKALKKDLAITYLTRDGVEYTDSIVEKYTKFVDGQDENIEENQKDESKLEKVKKVFKGNKARKELIKTKREEILSEVNSMKGNISKFESKMADMMTFECLILEKLQAKEFKSKTKWGVLDKLDDARENEVVIAIKNSNYRGTFIMSILEMYLKTYFNKEKLDLPVFKSELNEQYAGIMAKIYLPKSKHFREVASKKYKENPSSTLNAEIADKKIKKVQDEEIR